MRYFDMSPRVYEYKTNGTAGYRVETTRFFKEFISFKTTMRYFLFLLAIAACEAARIPRQVEYDHFPNFRSVYHGHGASSYQNVHLDGHAGGVPARSFNYLNGVSDFGLSHRENGFLPIFERGNELGHFDGHDAGFSSHGGIGSGHHGFGIGGHGFHGDRFDHGNYFGDHLGHGSHHLGHGNHHLGL